MAETHFPALVPSIIVGDVKATLDWFKALGFETVSAMEGPDGSIVHAEVRRGPDVWFMMGPPGPWGSPGAGGMSIYIGLQESVDAYHDQVVANGVAITEPLTDQFWGHRTFSVKHPDGYQITFAEHVRDVSEEEMKQAMEAMSPAAAST